MKGAPPPRGNVPKTSLRWSLDSAARELAMSPNTLQKVLNQASVTPGEDGCFSTAQLLSGVYGRMYEEKLKVQQQLARRYELANKITEGEFLNRVELEKSLGQLAAEMVFIIETSNLSREAQDDLRVTLASIPVEIAGVAKSQTKSLRRSKNGKKPEKDEGEG